MAEIRVFATVGFCYDTDDGLVTSKEDAIEDALSVIDSGDIPASQYDISVVMKDG